MIQVTAIPANRIHEVWSDIAPFMEIAADQSYGRFTAADILEQLFGGHHHLWVAFDDDNKIKGAVTTCFLKYPRRKYLLLEFCGGVEGYEWKYQMLKVLQHWAYDNDCYGLEATGRLGWEKIFKADGYKPYGQMFELPAATQGLGEQHG